jgi:5-amino-6-(5-phosphoribosylamino)uracil reductase
LAEKRQRPRTTVVLAMSADGKISDTGRSHPTFGSKQDFDHLERQVAAADAVLAGSATLKAGGTAMRVVNPELIAQRLKAGKPEQPIQIVCTRTADLDPTLRFFQQPVPRYLLTTSQGAARWQGQVGFDRILAGEAVSRGYRYQEHCSFGRRRDCGCHACARFNRRAAFNDLSAFNRRKDRPLSG